MSKLLKGQWRCHPDHSKFAVKVLEDTDKPELAKGIGWDARGRFSDKDQWCLQRTFLVANNDKIAELELRLEQQLNSK